MHFQRVALLSVSIDPLLDPQASFNVNRPATGQVLRSGFCLAPPERHAKPGGDIVILARVFIFALLIGGQAKAAHWRSLWRIAQFRIAAEVTDQNNFIERHFVLRYFSALEAAGVLRLSRDTTRLHLMRQAH